MNYADPQQARPEGHLQSVMRVEYGAAEQVKARIERLLTRLSGPRPAPSTGAGSTNAATNRDAELPLYEIACGIGKEHSATLEMLDEIETLV